MNKDTNPRKQPIFHQKDSSEITRQNPGRPAIGKGKNELSTEIEDDGEIINPRWRPGL
ncbi:hypothetical protein J7E71_25460 [Mesobacillus foraminis]|uniref:hypothetical protein n=1 Tax=Mesobacillus foraminis TaxID=279826 RepID=UPI001BEB977F|nr:hypothetical protein [Mesobacillus foraminis]MBT2759223.1 hypothetical protein [Mesobacillus foraminis]